MPRIVGPSRRAGRRADRDRALIGALGRAFSRAVRIVRVRYRSRSMAPDTTVRSILLPAGAEPPIRVYVNGEEWDPGTDFTVDGPYLRFNRGLRAQPKLGFGRSVMLALGIGVYGDLKGDKLDIIYQVGDRPQSASIPLTAGDAEEGPPRD